MKTKREWREDIKRKLRFLSKAYQKKASQRIRRRLYQLPEFKRAQNILFYVPIQSEVDTFPALQKCLRKKKSVVLPKLKRGRSPFVLRRIRNLKRDLAKGSYGVLEPRAQCRRVSIKELDLVICPGLAFDREGTRLGRSGGYYDRFLSRLPKKVPVFALIYTCQLVKKLPKEAHDIPIKNIITD